VNAYRTGSSKPMGREQRDCPGNKVHFPQEGLAGSSCPNRCPRDCCTSSRCVGGCACASAGSPIASRCFCSSNRGRYPVAYFPGTDVASHALERTDTCHPTPRFRAYVLVCGAGGRAHRITRSVAAHGAAGTCQYVAGTGRVRVAGVGGGRLPPGEPVVWLVLPLELGIKTRSHRWGALRSLLDCPLCERR
jgi:hypothetical protein